MEHSRLLKYLLQGRDIIKMAEPVKIKFEYENPDNVEAEVPGSQKIREGQGENDQNGGSQGENCDVPQNAGSVLSDAEDGSITTSRQVIKKRNDKQDKRSKTKIPVSRFKQTVERVQAERRGSKDKKEHESHIPVPKSSIAKPAKDHRAPPKTVKKEITITKTEIRKKSSEPTITQTKIIKQVAETEDEFDKIFADIIDTTDDVLDDNLLNTKVDDPEKLETKFEEIIHDYDERKVEPIDVEVVRRSRIPFLKRRSQQEIELSAQADRTSKIIAARDKLRLRHSLTKPEDFENALDLELNKAHTSDTNTVSDKAVPTTDTKTEKETKYEVITSPNCKTEITRQVVKTVSASSSHENENNASSSIVETTTVEEITSNESRDKKENKIHCSMSEENIMKGSIKVGIPVFDSYVHEFSEQNESTKTVAVKSVLSYTSQKEDVFVANNVTEIKNESKDTEIETTANHIKRHVSNTSDIQKETSHIDNTTKSDISTVKDKVKTDEQNPQKVDKINLKEEVYFKQPVGRIINEYDSKESIQTEPNKRESINKLKTESSYVDNSEKSDTIEENNKIKVLDHSSETLNEINVEEVYLRKKVGRIISNNDSKALFKTETNKTESINEIRYIDNNEKSDIDNNKIKTNDQNPQKVDIMNEEEANFVQPVGRIINKFDSKESIQTDVNKRESITKLKTETRHIEKSEKSDTAEDKNKVKTIDHSLQKLNEKNVEEVYLRNKFERITSNTDSKELVKTEINETESISELKTETRYTENNKTSDISIDINKIKTKYQHPQNIEDTNVKGEVRLRREVGKIKCNVNSKEFVEPETNKRDSINELNLKKSVLSKIAMFEHKEDHIVNKLSKKDSKPKLIITNNKQSVENTHVHTPLIVDEVFKTFQADIDLNKDTDKEYIPSKTNNNVNVVRAESVTVQSPNSVQYAVENKFQFESKAVEENEIINKIYSENIDSEKTAKKVEIATIRNIESCKDSTVANDLPTPNVHSSQFKYEIKDPIYKVTKNEENTKDTLNKEPKTPRLSTTKELQAPVIIPGFKPVSELLRSFEFKEEDKKSFPIRTINREYSIVKETATPVKCTSIATEATVKKPQVIQSHEITASATKLSYTDDNDRYTKDSDDFVTKSSFTKESDGFVTKRSYSSNNESEYFVTKRSYSKESDDFGTDSSKTKENNGVVTNSHSSNNDNELLVTKKSYTNNNSSDFRTKSSYKENDDFIKRSYTNDNESDDFVTRRSTEESYNLETKSSYNESADFVTNRYTTNNERKDFVTKESFINERYDDFDSANDFKSLDDVFSRETDSSKLKSRLEEDMRRAKSLAELDLGDAVKGKVNKMISRMKSVDRVLERKEVINMKEMPRKRSVSEKIALFEGKITPSRSEPPSLRIFKCGKTETNVTHNLETRADRNRIETLTTAGTRTERVRMIVTETTERDGAIVTEKIERDGVIVTDKTEKDSDSATTESDVEKESDKNDEEVKKKIQELSDAKLKYGAVAHMPRIELSNGNLMPVLSVGTAMLDPRLLPHVIKTAIDLGYRGIDTAYIYDNEQAVGEAIKEKIDDGTVKREDLFITSKLWSTFHRPDLVEAACRSSLEAMGLDYFDLFLIHNPMSFKEGGSPIPKIATVLQYSEFDYLDAWYGMEKLVAKGLAKSIGVSNFNSLQLQRVLDKGKVKPVVNQVECHPYLSQQRLEVFCSERQVTLMCFGALGSKGTPRELKGAVPAAIDDALVQVLASGMGVTPAQLLISYQLENSRGVVVKSSSAAHLWDNLQALNVHLTMGQVDALHALNRNKRMFTFKGMGDTHKNYPFNTAF